LAPKTLPPRPELENPLLRQTHATLPDLGDHLCYWLRYVADNISHRFHRKLKQRNLTEAEWMALRLMFGAGPGITHFCLIRSLCMPRSAISKLVSRLEARGLVRRRSADGEIRAQRLSLTAQGEALVPELAAVAESIEDYFFLHLTSSARAGLIATLRQLSYYHQFEFRTQRR